MVRRHHRAQRVFEGTQWIGEKVRDPSKCFFLFGIEDVKNRCRPKARDSSFPSDCAVQRAFGIDQDVSDVLHVADFVRSFADFEKRIVAGTAWIGRIEQQAIGKLASPAGCQLPVLAFDVVNDDALRPGQQRRNDQTDAFARTRRRKRHDVFWPVMAKIVATSWPRNTPAGRNKPAASISVAIAPNARNRRS